MHRSTRWRAAALSALAALAVSGPARADDYLAFLEGSLDLEGVRAPSSEIVRRLQGAHQAAFARVAQDFGAIGLGESEVRHLWIANAVAVTIDKTLAPELAQLPGVARVEPVGIVPAPEFSVGEAVPTEGDITWSIAKVNAPRVWNELGLDGEGVIVGHIDTGADPNHPDLAGKIVAFKDFLDANNTTPKDGQGHGTHTAGTIAGGAAGGTAIGMAPKAKLIVARVFSNQGATTEALLKSMQWILDPDGNPSTDDAPPLCSNSWGSNATTDKSFWAAVQAWRAAGVLPVFAAGNAGPNAKTVGIPGGYPHSFAVGATQSSDAIARFSSRGPVKWDGTERVKPDVSAPGQNVYSAKDGGGYWSISGTSMACPNVAGAATLIFQKNPGISLEAVEAALMNTARDMGAPGKDNDFGTGIIDAYAAIASLSSSTIKGRVTDGAGNGLAATLVFNGKSIQIPASGEYSVRAAKGTHTLEFKLFGYQTRTETVVISGDESVDLSVSLQAVPSAPLSGTVRGPDGEGVRASIQVLDTPLATQTAGNDGSFSFPVPQGSYQVRFSATGYHPATVSATAGGAPLAVVLGKAKGVLVVDDDGGADFENAYKAALVDRPGGFDLLSGENAPESGAALAGYASVIWVTGDRRTSIKSSALRALGEYLDQGGSVLMTGQNLAEGIAESSFLKERLRAKLVSGAISTDFLEPHPGNALASKMPSSGLSTGDDGVGHTTTPDALLADGPGAFEFLRYKVLWGFVKRFGGVASRNGSAATVLLGFGLEGLDGAAKRKQVLASCLDWMQAGAEADRMALFRALGAED